MTYRLNPGCKIAAMLTLMILLGAAPQQISAQQQGHHKSGTSGATGRHHGGSKIDGNADYAGQQSRAIKSLSPKDIADLKAGKGWGLAKAAELNGVPGPAHLLELKSQLGLNPAQIEQIEGLFTDMRREAQRLGAEYIESERLLNDHFARGTINEATLRELLDRIAKVRTALRFTHLETHLRTPAILTRQQTTRYNELRGYAKNPRH